MMCHPSTWNPPPSNTDLKISCDGDAWSYLAGLMNHIKGMVLPDVLSKERLEGYEPVILAEDSALSGFVPLLTLPQDNVYCPRTFDKECAKNLVRLQRLQYCGDYLCGIIPPVLRYSVELRAYISLVTDTSELDSASYTAGKSVDPDVVVEDTTSEDDDVEGDVGDGLISSSVPQHSEIQHLLTLKQELQRRRSEQEMRHKHIQAVLDSASQEKGVTMVIQPRYLVPDTNCFIDHLAALQKVVATNKFILVIPIVVLNELQGLAKGSRPGPATGGDQARGHWAVVGEGARNALAFLKECFSSCASRVKTVTARGSLLDSMAFRSEDTVDSESTNDDLILGCTLHLCSDSADNRDVNDDLIKIYRNVVLLTDDRNLRVKAHAQDVPVQGVIKFLQLMQL